MSKGDSSGTTQDSDAYLWTIRRLAILFVLSDFVEVILVELANKAGKVAVLEVLRQYCFCKLLILLTAPCLASCPPRIRRILGRTSRTTKLSPSFPHRTTDAYWGSSSILYSGSALARRDIDGARHTCRVCEPGGDVSVELGARSAMWSGSRNWDGRGLWIRLTKSLELLPPVCAAMSPSGGMTMPAWGGLKCVRCSCPSFKAGCRRSCRPCPLDHSPARQD